MLIAERLSRSRQHQRDVVGLFRAANPVIDRSGHELCNPFKRKVAIFLDEVYQALLAEFAEIIFRLGDAVTVGEKNFARAKLDRGFIIMNVIEEADTVPPSSAAYPRSPRAPWGQMPQVLLKVSFGGRWCQHGERTSRVFFLRRAVEQLMIQQREHVRGTISAPSMRDSTLERTGGPLPTTCNGRRGNAFHRIGADSGVNGRHERPSEIPLPLRRQPPGSLSDSTVKKS